MHFDTATKLKTWIVSFIALLLFIVPVSIDGQWTIMLGVMAEGILANLEGTIPAITTTAIVVFLLITIYGTFVNKSLFSHTSKLQGIFVLGPLWFILRFTGAVIAVMVITRFGPEAITGDPTGGTMMYSLVPILATWLLLAAFLMPLLMNFGLMEFVGTFLEPIIRPLFRVPGRSSIDALASWMGSSPVGVMITTEQYEKGFYTKREALTIATNFSVLSIPFSLVIATVIGIEHYFLQFYLTMTIACLFTTLILVRIPPLSIKEETYYEATGSQIDERTKEDNMLETAKLRAYRRTAESDRPKGLLKDGTIALILAEYTPVFTFLSYPVQMFLDFILMPEAAAAAPAFIIGITDMFLPAVIGSGIESDFTKFLIAVMSLTQIIYFSEVGAL